MSNRGKAKRRRARPGRVRPKTAKRGAGLRRAVILLLAAALPPALAVTGLMLWNVAAHRPPSDPITPRAAIVDQLGLTSPSREFIDSATNKLERAGYSVDYYPPEEVTVDMYRDLPTRGYEFIILRSHSGLVRETGWTETALFTSEPYSPTKYVEEQRSGRLAIAANYDAGPRYFALEGDFIESSMRGRFDNTTVILMGCDGLRNDTFAATFLGKGAKSFISWDRPVSADRTDTATERLLEHLLIGGLSAEEAVTRTTREVEPDPTFGAELRVVSEG